MLAVLFLSFGEVKQLTSLSGGGDLTTCHLYQSRCTLHLLHIGGRHALGHIEVILQTHTDAVGTHGQGSRSIYAYGWLLDIARCMYTLVNGKLTTKTAAAQWALDEHLTPCPAELAMALTVRRQPELIRDESVLDYAEHLTDAIQSYAALLDKALSMHK